MSTRASAIQAHTLARPAGVRTGAFNFVPLFAQERQVSEDAAWRLASQLLAYWTVLLVLVVLGVLVLSPLAAPLVAPGFEGGRLASFLGLTRILLLMAVLVGASRLLSVVLQAQGRFLVAGLSEVVFQVASISWLVAFHDRGVTSLAWGQAVGGLAQLAVVGVALGGRIRSLWPRRPLWNPAVRRFVKLSLPVYLGDSGDKVNLLVTRAFGSTAIVETSFQRCPLSLDRTSIARDFIIFG